jgi:alpha-tubulin suppressor-like RCC1 family protein
VAYLARCARQRRFGEAPLIAAGHQHSLFLDASSQLLTCGETIRLGYGGEIAAFISTPVTLFAGLRVMSVAAGAQHSLALGWDGRVYSWGHNEFTQLDHGDTLRRLSPTLVDDLEGVRGIAARS